MKAKEVKLIKCEVVSAVPGWKVGDIVMVDSNDPRIGKILKEVAK